MLANCTHQMSLRTWRRPLLRTKSLLPPDPRHKPRLLCQKCFYYVWVYLRPMSNKYTQIYPVCLEWTCLLICREFAYCTIFEFIQQSGKPAYEAILAETAKLKEVLAKHQDSLQKDCGTEQMESPISRHSLGRRVRFDGAFAPTVVGWLILLIIDSMFSVSSFKWRRFGWTPPGKLFCDAFF